MVSVVLNQETVFPDTVHLLVLDGGTEDRCRWHNMNTNQNRLDKRYYEDSQTVLLPKFYYFFILRPIFLGDIESYDKIGENSPFPNTT